MKFNKEFILKNLITICCIASVLFLLLPFASVSVEVESDFVDASSSSSVSGFDVIFGDSAVFIGCLMLICPIVLVAMNYIKQLDKYKSLLAIILPVLSLISAIVCFSMAGSASAGADAGAASVEAKVSAGIGFILLIIAYIGTLVSGAVTFYGLKFSKEGLAEFGNKLKEEGLSGVESVKGLGAKAGNAVSGISGKVSELSGNIKQNVAERRSESDEANQDTSETSVTVDNTAPASSSNGNSFVQKPVKKTNINQVNDVLSLIKQLAEMKEQGILTEEEFSEKKKELLAQI